MPVAFEADQNIFMCGDIGDELLFDIEGRIRIFLHAACPYQACEAATLNTVTGSFSPLNTTSPKACVDTLPSTAHCVA